MFNSYVTNYQRVISAIPSPTVGISVSDLPKKFLKTSGSVRVLQDLTQQNAANLETFQVGQLKTFRCVCPGAAICPSLCKFCEFGEFQYSSLL